MVTNDLPKETLLNLKTIYAFYRLYLLYRLFLLRYYSYSTHCYDDYGVVKFDCRFDFEILHHTEY